jgi:MATE family multidrug resistance protein
MLAGPVIASQLAQISMGVADTMMCGQVSKETLAAVSLASAVWLVVWLIGYGPMLAVSPSVAQAYGAGRFLEAGRITRQAILLSLAISAVLGSLAWIFLPGMLLSVGGEDAAMSTAAVRYIVYVIPALPAILLSTVLRGLTEGVGKTGPVLLASVLGFLANIVGNWLLIFGNLGFPRMEAAGAACATVLAQWVIAGSLFAWILFHRNYAPYSPFKNWEPPHLDDWWTLLKLGVPIGVSLLLEVSLFTVVALLMVRFGTVAQSAHQIALNVASVTFMVPLGIAFATTVRVGHAIGRRDHVAARRSGFVGISAAALFMLASGLVLWTIPGSIIRLYTRDAEVRLFAIQLLQLAAFFQLSDGLQVSAAGALRGVKDTTATMIITLVAYWVVGLPAAYILGITWEHGPVGMWIGLIAGLSVAAALLNLRFDRLTRSLSFATRSPDAKSDDKDLSIERLTENKDAANRIVSIESAASRERLDPTTPALAE